MDNKKKCLKCKGKGYFDLSKERILAYPRYTAVYCPDCGGTGKAKKERL